MNIGSRLRVARKQKRLSVRKLGEIVGVSGVAVSKYERDLDMPSSGVLMRLCQALNLSLERLFRSTAVILSEPAYRKRSDLPVKECKTIMAAVQDKAERYSEAEELARRHERPKLPTLSVSNAADAEEAANKLRSDWRLGRDAIPSMVALLEDHDIQVIELAAHDHFDACALESDVDRLSSFVLEPLSIESVSRLPTSWLTWFCNTHQASCQRGWLTVSLGHFSFPLILQCASSAITAIA